MLRRLVPDNIEFSAFFEARQDEVVIDIVNSTIPYDGQFFGDWMVFYHGDSTDEQ